MQSGSIERLKEEGWEPKLRVSTEEQVVESMETVLLLGRSGTGKTICIANKMQADRRVAPGKSQFFDARSPRICLLVASLQGSGTGVQSQDNLHFLTLHEVIHNVVSALGLADKKPWDRKDLRVDYLKFKRDIFPAVLAARRRTATCTIDALVVWTVMRPRSFIKGSYEAVLGIDSTGGRQSEGAGKPIDVVTLLNLGEERLRLSPEQRREAFELCHKCRAEFDSKSLWEPLRASFAQGCGVQTNTVKDQNHECMCLYPTNTVKNNVFIANKNGINSIVQGISCCACVYEHAKEERLHHRHA
jgi:hypothetical protein